MNPHPHRNRIERNLGWARKATKWSDNERIALVDPRPPSQDEGEITLRTKSDDEQVVPQGLETKISAQLPSTLEIIEKSRQIWMFQ